jgi:predicted flap endonuclease-1-like 5' DNA nuclease
MVEVYDLDTGETLRRKSVTALECVENGKGRFTLAKPSEWPPQTETAAPVRPALQGPSPSPEPGPAVGAAEGGGLPDNFMKIRGVGMAMAERLQEAGYRTFASIAATTASRLASDIHAPGYNGAKIREERWIEQAAAYAKDSPNTPAAAPQPEPEPKGVEPSPSAILTGETAAIDAGQPAPQPTEEPEPA